MVADAIDLATDLFASYARLWASVESVLCFMQPFNAPNPRWLSSFTPILLMVIILPVEFVFAFAVAMRLGMYVGKAPFIFDSAWWHIQTDVVLLAAIMLLPRRAVIPAVARVTAAQMGIFYFAAGFWKINTSFLDPTVSCAPIFSLSLMAEYLPETMTPNWLVGLAARASPVAVIVGEMSIGILLLLPSRAGRRLGVLLCAVLHLGITLTPFPNQIASFSVFGLSRMFLVIAPSWAAAQAELLAVPKDAGGLAYRSLAVACAAASCSLSTNPAVTVDWCIPLYVLLCFICGRALVIDRGFPCLLPLSGEAYLGLPPSPSKLPSWIPRWLPARFRALRRGVAASVGVFALLASLTYAFGLQALGLMDVGAASPFASIRLHGGSNHLLMPTGLLQAFADSAPPVTATTAPPETSVGRVAVAAAGAFEAAFGVEVARDAFGGGVVRVESCTSEFLNALYPSDISSAFSPRTVRMLLDAGHSARQFNPTVRRVLGAELRRHMPRWDARSGTPFVPYTLPALELRRMLAEAREANESFTLTYVRLPGALGDNGWRANASGVRVTVTEDGQGGSRCVVGTSFFLGSACAEDEIALLPPPSGLAQKLMLFFPLPVLPGHTELPCMD